MEQIVRDMVGRSITEFYPDRRNKPGEVLLEVNHFEQPGVFHDINFNLRKGEILALPASWQRPYRNHARRFGVDPHAGGELVSKARL